MATLVVDLTLTTNRGINSIEQIPLERLLKTY